MATSTKSSNIREKVSRRILELSDGDGTDFHSTIFKARPTATVFLSAWAAAIEQLCSGHHVDGTVALIELYEGIVSGLDSHTAQEVPIIGERWSDEEPS